MISAITQALNPGEILLLCVIGLAIVIAALIVLIVLITIISKGVNAVDNALSSAKKNVGTGTVPAPVAAGAESEDEETVAAITAALLAFYEVSATDDEEIIPPPFVIRSIKKN